MNTLLALLLLLPLALFAAEGDIPIEQADGTIRTQTVSGDAVVTANGVVTVSIACSNITDAGTVCDTDANEYATAAQGGLAESAVQPSAIGVAGIMPGVILGDSIDVAVTLDGRAYEAHLVGSGDLIVSAPADGTLRYTMLYLTSGGAWELSTPGAAQWLDGAWETLDPAVGETIEVGIRRLPSGQILLSARRYY
jgi:hypothetical protein